MSPKHQNSSHLVGLINPSSRQPVKPPGLLRVIQKNSSGHFQHLLAHLFSTTDDLFYDLSKRASSNQEQNLYFEAMREIRIKREGIANQFLRKISESFQTLIEQPPPHIDGLDDWDDEPESNLSIVEGDDLETDLAMSNMVSHTRDEYRTELHELVMRLDHLLLQVNTDEDNNPLDPSIITTAFVNACQSSLDTGIKAKLILYKLFDKHVLKQLGHIYSDANQVLIEAGILPKVPKSLKTKPDEGIITPSHEPETNLDPTHNQGQNPAPEQTAYNLPAADFSMGHEALSLLMEAARNIALRSGDRRAPQPLLGASATPPLHQGPPGHYNTPQYYLGTTVNDQTHQAVNCYIYTSNPGPVMKLPELTQHLTQSQPQLDQQLSESKVPANMVSNVVHLALADKDPEVPQALEQDNENIINLVALFFDQILADEALPVAIQSLICRLQIPILKLALKDQSFFNEPEHPARVLINTITTLGIGFDESKPVERDPIYKKIESTVKTINKNFKNEECTFSEQQEGLDKLVNKEKRKATMVEQRTTQTEAGKSRIKQAQTTTQNLIYQKIKDTKLPDEIKDFLTTHWLQVMVMTNLKKGTDSSEWASNEQTISDLVWISKEHNDTRSIQRRERLLPELLDRIEGELETAIDNQTTREECVSLLENTLHNASHDPTTEDALTSLSEEQKNALGKGENAPKAWDEMSPMEKQKARYDELASSHYEAARNVPVGSWIEFTNEGNNKVVRCKLAAKIDADTYLFVNRFGFKALEKTRKQLAYDMQFNRAKILDARPLFDRAMGRIVGNLKPH